jgi:hypothetical protein
MVLLHTSKPTTVHWTLCKLQNNQMGLTEAQHANIQFFLPYTTSSLYQKNILLMLVNVGQYILFILKNICYINFELWKE